MPRCLMQGVGKPATLSFEGAEDGAERLRASAGDLNIAGGEAGSGATLIKGHGWICHHKIEVRSHRPFFWYPMSR